MTLEDLERDGMLLPREEWGQHDLHTTANQPAIFAVGVVGMASSVMIYWGNGGAFTWIGLVLSLAALAGFTVLSCQAVNRQQIRRASDETEH